MAAAALVLPWRPRIRLLPEVLEVRGFFVRRSVPLGKITEVYASRVGLEIHWGEGHITTVSAVGERGLLGALVGGGRRTDRMIERILVSARAHQTQDPRPVN